MADSPHPLPGAHVPSFDTTGELLPLPQGLASLGAQHSPGGRRVLIALMLAALAFALYVVWPFRVPLFLAVVLAATLFPLHLWLEARLRGRTAVSALLVTLGLVAALALPIASVSTFVAREILRGVAWVRESLGINSVNDLSFSRLPPKAAVALNDLLAVLHLSQEDAKRYLGKGLDWAQNASSTALGASASIAGGTVLMLVALYVLLLDGKQALRYLKSISPLSREQTSELFLEFRNATSAAVLGTAVTALVQGLLATIGYLVAGVPHPFFLGVTTLMASFIPAVGTLLVWVPVCGVLVFDDRSTVAIGLAVYSLVVVAGSDNVVKPLVMRGRVAMHGGLVLLSLLGGVITFGMLGIILGPLIFSFLVALMRIYKRDYLEQPGA